MARASIGGIIPALALLFLTACSGLWLDCYWRSEKYVLLAVDAKSQMSLSLDMGGGSALGLVGPTVFAIGSDAKYIVVKQHPARNSFATEFDRSVTDYYIVERSQSPDFQARQKLVSGHFSEAQYADLTKKLSLPPFTKTFADLE